MNASAATTQSEAVSALSKLHFMAGSWRCVTRGVPNNGYVSKLSYSFTPDGLFMIESESSLSSKYPRTWSLQMWGYDMLHKTFDSYQFTPAGIFTKTIQGWKNGEFVSTRDDNGSTVSIRQRSSRAFDWLIKASGGPTVTEACTR